MAQDPKPIIVNGNVYGGGNKGKVEGNTTVTVVSGDLNKVFGGARMAEVGGRSFVNIDGKNTTEYIVINQVYGGNDVAGTIGKSGNPTLTDSVPTELVAVKRVAADDENPKKNKINNTWKTFVRVSGDAEEIVEEDGKSTKHAVFIGSLFAGGNGDFTYTDDEGNALMEGGKYAVKEGGTTIALSDKPFSPPVAKRTYIELHGGTIVHAFGGGNNATVTDSTVISVENPTEVVCSIKDPQNPNRGTTVKELNELLTEARLLKMGVNPGLSHAYSDEFQIGNLFGGNNNTAMAIMPTWNLQAGKIRNLYSGGNKGNMIARNGILLRVDPAPMNGEDEHNVAKNDYPLVIDNVYGGCRIADVRPMMLENGVYKDVEHVYNLAGYNFPQDLAARTVVYGGDINNIYGGNDIRGKVYFGNAVGLRTSIRGNLYGGGNGSYPYTDNEALKDDPTYADLYYDPGSSSIDSLNALRPHAEQVSIRLAGEADRKTIVHGSVFVGGNSATLHEDERHKDYAKYPLVELKMGSHVIAENVFLGNNGENMIASNEAVLDETGRDILVREGVLRTMKSEDKITDENVTNKKFNSIDLTDSELFAEYMEGAAMELIPNVVFDNAQLGDPSTYIPYSSQVGSLFLGGNVGSMTYRGTNAMTLNAPIYIYNKVVGGCNNADVPKTEYNAAYEGGILGFKGTVNNEAIDERSSYTDGSGNIKDRLVLTLDGVRVRPQRWARYDDGTYRLNANKQEYLEWNTMEWNETYTAVPDETPLEEGNTYYTSEYGEGAFIAKEGEVKDEGTNYYVLSSAGFEDTDIGNGEGTGDDDRRLIGGNIYGGCYNTGHVNGNVVINVNSDVHERDVLFAQTTTDDDGNISIVDDYEEDTRRTGVIKENQRDDLMAVGLSILGGGKGKGTEIWGSTTVNYINGYAFQAFGGGEEGYVGKGTIVKDNENHTQYDSQGYIQKTYEYNAAYSSTVNLNGTQPIYKSEGTVDGLTEAEYLYGGGNEGDVCGDVYVNLGHGRVYDAFGGACNADILGAVEVTVGPGDGFPYVIDNIYAGNDFGGTVQGSKNHLSNVRKSGETPLIFAADLANSSTYVNYIQGRVDSIFGGCYGNYYYEDRAYKKYTDAEGNPLPGSGFTYPHLTQNSFVHFHPNDNSNNKVGYIFGGSAGAPGSTQVNNGMQSESYVLIDDNLTTEAKRYENMDVYGGGAFAGVGTHEHSGTGRTIVDLYAGNLHNVYGGCNQEGMVGYTRVNVPTESTIKLNAIFGGSKGYDADLIAEKPELNARYCDNYVTIVDFKGANTIVEDAIYGGNHNCRVACDTYVNIEAPVLQSSGRQATVYGAGYGAETVSGRTNVFMNDGSVAYKVFGGGRDGNVFNFASLRKWLTGQYVASGITSASEIEQNVVAYAGYLTACGGYFNTNHIPLPAKTGTYVNSEGKYDGTYTIDILQYTTGESPTLVLLPDYHQTNVHLMQGSHVTGYAYGGGFGSDAIVGGTTYLELKGGTVDRDIYGGGQGGSVMDEYELANDDATNDFVATTNVYIEGGTARNVYGGGYQGHVGKHTKTVNGKLVDAGIQELTRDFLGVANVTIGKLNGTSFLDGVPAILRNVYGAGEGGSVWGTTNVNINNGYIGYRYVPNETDGTYVEELDDAKPNDLDLAGNVFGGGYVVNSYVDETYVNMYGGTLRGSLFGGGEVGPIGRGTVKYKDALGYNSTGLVNNNARIYKAGKTNVKMYDGHVMRNVFGGGRGKDSWGGDGTKFMDESVVAAADLKCKGFVFGQTEVDIYGGEIGTDEGVVLGYGNVFGGGDVGFVYSAYQTEEGLAMGKKSGVRYNVGLTSGQDGYNDEGYYYKWEKSGDSYSFGSTKTLTEDCKVLVEPWLKANTDVTINEESFKAGKFVPTSALNYLGNKDDENWTKLGVEDPDKNGIIIHNAVFAGGNTSPGSTEVYANATTVYGNATASINDVYHRDLITIGRGRVGGLYGDGNLTLVDGYRELNITNYGTDYYSINTEIDKTTYDALPKREQAYYEIRYKCIEKCRDKNDRTYTSGSTITADELLTKFIKIVKVTENNVEVEKEVSVQYEGKDVLVYNEDDHVWEPNTEEGASFWVENGVCSRYAGRPMNTIQRADFCGVFGSRMVMQGAQDRVPETVDYTNYTINRVREVSLNKKLSAITDDAAAPYHGNYFGIYNTVNFLGALTSDVDFSPSGALRSTTSDNSINLPDADPTKVTITAKTVDAKTAAESIDDITVSGSAAPYTVTASTAKALYELRSQAISGIEITLKEATTITANSEAQNSLTEHPIEGIEVSGSTVTAESLDAYYRLRAANIKGITVTNPVELNQTFYDWKAIHHEEKKRNNGTCYNKVALASGVHLELTTEQSTGPGLYEKEWGYITGVVELDLINVQPGVGGGFVYAKNEHGVRSGSALSSPQHTLATLNTGAITRKAFTYTPDDNTKKEWETSGNFINSTQTIIDDCYNIGGKYKTNYEAPDGVPAHYWYVKGSIYVYDQYISAYTGSPNAFSETVNIPLTITSASHGKMTLMDVMPNYYAYYANTTGTTKEKLGADATIELRDVTYKLNDPITYWDYFMLNDDEKKLFVPRTYITTDSCKIGENKYPAGYVMLPEEYTQLNGAAELKDLTPEDQDNTKVRAVIMMTKDKDGNPVVEKDKDGNPIYKPFHDIFRESNNLSHNTGYILTYKINNPNLWNQWQTEELDSDHDANKAKEKEQNTSDYDATLAGYINGPTYKPKAAGLYGQLEYQKGNIISQDVYYAYEGYNSNNDTDYDDADDIKGLKQLVASASATMPEDQAEFEPAFIVTKDVLEGTSQRFYKGATLGESNVESGWYTTENATTNSVEPAYVVTSTIQLDKANYIYRGMYMTKKEMDDFKNDYASLETEIDKYIVPAYYCKKEGKYGGNYFMTGQNYYAKEAFSELSKEDRDKFIFNYDALDLLIDSLYSYSGRNLTGELKYKEGEKYQYDGATYDAQTETITPFTTEDQAKTNKAQYSLPTSIDYTATFKGGSLTYTYEGTEKTIRDNDEISGKEYESLLNERYYYSPINVNQVVDGNGDPYPYYVVNKTMILGDTPYAAGQVIDKETYDALPATNQSNDITKLTFDADGIYYYCREPYTIAAAADGGKAVTDYMSGSEATETAPAVQKTVYSPGQTVPFETVITSDNFKSLTNNQANFVIHGTAPTETSTLFVTRNSDIKDLSQEKIITVVYEYNYVESDMMGMNIVPVSERHVLNIHINFKSGVPTVEDITAPDIVIPGTTVSIKEPYVEPGAYVVTGGGWELFDDPYDATSHTNGIEYTPGDDPLYLYQNNYWVAYYAKTYLGKAYSNAVQVSVANSHDLKKVMEAEKHHYYIDHQDLFKDAENIVEPKIYINDYSKDESGKTDGLDLFKDLYDLSVLHTGTPDDIYKVTTNNEGLIESGTFEGHKPLNDRVRAGNHLEFILRTDIERGTRDVEVQDPAFPDDPTKKITVKQPLEWTPIASKNTDPCFMGTLHGDGHTISNLDHSLFQQLCGDVYNLGVTGSFTGAGIAETGEGYIENSWISTTSTAAKTSQPVFGNPSRTEDPRGLIQVVNSYYREDNADAFDADGTTEKTGSYTKQIKDYNVTSHGTPIRKQTPAFYNGEVAYDLNGFYLYKRYNDNAKPGGSANYYYWLPDNTERQEGTYASNPTYSSAGYNNAMYVEDRYADGDYRYADGTIPEDKDKRQYSYTIEDEQSPDFGKIKNEFYPIWPADYIFFGQKLTYGYSDTKAHDPFPAAVADDNHVYRAPAYFRDSNMGVAHFNPDAILAAKSADGTREAYPGMTAIDFAGHNDTHDEKTGANKAYGLANETGLFYTPLLDDDGLTSIMNADETQNLLVYAPAETSDDGYANKMTHDVLNGYFVDPKYDTYSDANTSSDKKYSDGKQYGRVALAPVNNVYGHVVQSDLTATNDHFLVDRQDFNAPFEYTFGEEHRMWYQRTPDNFVEIAWSEADENNPSVRSTKGWEGVSIPFEAEVVATNQKGEITHFYKKSAESNNYERGYDSGHEYWLRQFTGVGTGTETEVPATMVYPTASKSLATKEVKNKFLWDYYYEALAGHHWKDANDDTYQTYYEKPTRKYENYPHLTNGTPYIIGFPGKSYYEFDLSGTFQPSTTAGPQPAKLGTQTITFASSTGETIHVSDDEKNGVEKGGYIFKPSYLNEVLEAGTNYVLNSDGNAYTQLSDGIVAYKTTGATYADANAFNAAKTAASDGMLYTDEDGTTEAAEWTNAETTYYTRTGVKTTVNDQNNVTPSLSAFRPYFTKSAGAGAPRRIIFAGADDKLQEDLTERHSGDDDGGLYISVDKRDIVVESTRRDNATVRIVTASGVRVATFTIEPGQIIRTTVPMTGVYMVNRSKLMVK